jgi:hypothetical protein
MPRSHRTVRRRLYIYVRDVIGLVPVDVREHVLDGITLRVRAEINDRLRNFTSGEINQRLVEQQRPSEVPFVQES